MTDLEASPSDVAVVQSIIDLGHRLGMTVLAEGIESSAVADRLQSLDCDDLQGYWIARPMVCSEVLDWADQHAAGNLLAVADGVEIGAGTLPAS